MYSELSADLVSVVIPFYNGNNYIKETLDSLLAQSVNIFEIIIVEDINSEAVDISPSYLNCRVVTNDTGEKGAGVCRWLGAKLAVGSLICFIDSDDIWPANKLEKQIHFMSANRLDFSFMSFQHFSHDSGRNFAPIFSSPPFNMHRFLSKEFVIPCSTVALTSRAAKLLEPNTLKRRNDYFMWFSLLKKLHARKLLWGGCPEVGCYHRLHNKSLTKSKIASFISQYILYRACGLSFYYCCYYMVHYCLNARGTR